MKFKLNKSSHQKHFNFLKQFDKSKLILKENKVNQNSSLIFKNINNSLYIYTFNAISACEINLDISIDVFEDFFVDLNSFCNAFNNFPSEEINFIYDENENFLIFGNKKTKVSLKTTPLNKNLQNNNKINSDNLNFKTFDNIEFYNALKCVISSCSNEIDEYPYNSIMFYVESNNFCTYASDKHRISIYGNKFAKQESWLLNKLSAEIIMNFLKDNNIYSYNLENNRLILNKNGSSLLINVNNNDKQNLFLKMNEFIENSLISINTKIDKNELLKSLKFISSFSNNETVNLNFHENVLAITSDKFDNSSVVDKILLSDNFQNLEVSFLTNHFIKILEMLSESQIELNILNYNGYKLCNLKSYNFEHIMFPMN